MNINTREVFKMPIISILNPKGGSGKTTLSTNLARALHERGLSVLIVDSDPQGSARDWHAAAENNPLPLIALDRAKNIKTLFSVGASYDYVIIDGAAKLEDMIAAGIKAADFVLIPVQPSPYDIWAASDLVEFIKARQEVTDGTPKTSFVITRAIKRTKLGREIGEALEEYGLPVFENCIMQRQAYPQTAAEGLTVFDSGNTAAMGEMNALTDELINFIATPSEEGAENGTIIKTA
jgi:chromosome partitioning protein